MSVTNNYSAEPLFFTHKADEPRINIYSKYENIFLGNHEAAFNPKINFQPGDNNLYIKELVGQLISYTSADYLFGEAITIVNENEGSTFVDDFYEFNPSFDTQLYESSLANSYFGDIVMELKLVDGETKIVFHDPRYYSVKLGSDGEPEQHIFNFVVRSGNDRYVYRRIHEKGTIYNQLFKIGKKVTTQIFIADDRDLQVVPLSTLYPEMAEEESTGLDDEFLVRCVPNVKLLNMYYGLSDYQGKESLMNALNVLTSFAHLILEKNADPAMEVPVGTFTPDANVFVEDLKVFQTDAETKGIPRYVTWDGNLTSLFEQRTHVMEMIALYSEISLSLMGQDKNGAVPDNYRAMKLRFHRTLQKMNRKKRYWEPALTWVFQTSQKLLGKTPDEYSYIWADGLPDDEQTRLEEMALAKGLGVLSNDTLIEEFGNKKGWSDERIEQEKAKLLNQTQSNAGVTEGATNLFTRQTVVNADDQQ